MTPPPLADTLHPLFLLAQSHGSVESIQLWAADDLGFHPRFTQGIDSNDDDRAVARNCCLSQQPQAQNHCLALPIHRKDGSACACLFRFSDDIPAELAAEAEEAIAGFVGAVDEALEHERMTRLAGISLDSDQLRHCLALAHGIHNCEDMRESLARFHHALCQLMPAENFFVVVLNQAREQLDYVYFHDQYDQQHDWQPLPFVEGELQGSLSAHVVAAGRILRGPSSELMRSAGHSDKIEDDDFGPQAFDWLGVPMRVGDEVIGALVTQSYHPDLQFSASDPSLLSMLADALAAALQRRRARESLQQQVIQRTADLEQAKTRAEQALAQLQATQEQLLQAEHLAALGRLVAGVAHEINTPLGNALTTASGLSGQFTRLREQFEKGLSKSQLASFIDTGDEAAEILQRNLQRAAELVRSFKQVAADQTAGQRRCFNLKEYLESLLLSLSPAWKNRPVEVLLSCPMDIQLDSFPGPLGQVITNLVTNSLTHGYEWSQAGQIRITVSQSNDGVCMDVTDDGKGMNADQLKKCFEPFYTNARHLGGTGLGLTIAHNNTVGVLGGSIEASTTAQGGCQITVQLPYSAPSESA
jgi:signal transduction histidine kinase